MKNEPKLIESPIEIHPIAMLIPEMDQSDFEALKEDISGLGLIDPVVIYEGMILDGRHRYRACQELGIDCFGREWEGGMDPVEYVVSENVKRRHLNQGQKAMIKISVSNFFVEDARRRQREAGRFAGKNQDGTPKLKDVQVVVPVPQAEANSEPQKAPVRVRDQIAKSLNVGAKTVGDAQKVYNEGTEEDKKAVLSGKKSVKKTAAEIRERKKVEPRPADKQTFNETNDNIEWARWTWNPVTGCKHGCPYCYARDIANRFYPEKFEPTYHPERLEAPRNTIIPKRMEYTAGVRNVFVCSMADLFGDWVPREWIQAVLESVAKSPEWTFIFLTKNPKRYLEFEFANNCWIGATADTQERMDGAIAVFKKLGSLGRTSNVRFVSCEPLLEQIRIPASVSPDLDWVIIGGQSKSSACDEFQPEWEWVEKLTSDARSVFAKVYWKPNLKVRPREFPES